jgi:hypothetical protein
MDNPLLANQFGTPIQHPSYASIPSDLPSFPDHREVLRPAVQFCHPSLVDPTAVAPSFPPAHIQAHRPVVQMDHHYSLDPTAMPPSFPFTPSQVHRPVAEMGCRHPLDPSALDLSSRRAHSHAHRPLAKMGHRHSLDPTALVPGPLVGSDAPGGVHRPAAQWFRPPSQIPADVAAGYNIPANLQNHDYFGDARMPPQVRREYSAMPFLEVSSCTYISFSKAWGKKCWQNEATVVQSHDDCTILVGSPASLEDQFNKKTHTTANLSSGAVRPLLC